MGTETPDHKLFAQAVICGAVGGVVMAVCIVVLVLSTGATFGQRCEAKGFAKWSDEWDQCIDRLRHAR